MKALLILINSLIILSISAPCCRGNMGSTTETSITVTEWGSIDGSTVEKYTLKGAAGQEVEVITYGATIVAIKTPDNKGRIADIVLGFDSIEGYSSEENPYLGSTVGRVANRVGNAEFQLDGKKYRLAKNAGKHSLHGGYKGWSGKIWKAAVENDLLVMSLLSEDGDEGYPGAAIASVQFSLSTAGELAIEMKVFVSRASPINLTNHSYFNLAGHSTNATELYKHRVAINADRWTVTDSESIPTGELRSVIDTPMDLRKPIILRQLIENHPANGYDENFCLPKVPAINETELVARVEHLDSGRYLEVYSNQPGVQFYTANYLPSPNSTGLLGKDGAVYFRHGAFCLETQNYPDAVNHKNFPNSILRPGHLYRHVVIYKFGALF